MTTQPRLTQLARRPGPAPPPVAPVPAPAPAYEEPAGYAYDEWEVLWLEIPPTLAPYARLGIVHTTAQCPAFVLRLRDEDDEAGNFNEIVGSPVDMLDLATAITNANKRLNCMSDGIASDASRAAEAQARRLG